jgi:hypothetical protein
MINFQGTIFTQQQVDEWFSQIKQKGNDNFIIPNYKMYQLTPHTIKQAKELGVEVRPSTRKGKKVDVYEDGKYVASIGAVGYGDYGTYLQEKGKAFADERRRLYRIRHTKNTLGERLSLFLLW